ncbi:MAG: hypothetical protein IJH92_05870 [Mogibacterium sp.]|nr:hypothetical protein [Mogibacterium sp.]
MTDILNVLTHIGNYAGPGMMIAIIGLVITVLAIIKLSRLRKKERSVSRAEFNRSFVNDTGFGISDVEEGAMRREAARELGIGSGRH